ncbi:MAG: tRNA pseudouridine(55) synthase TruB [Planctomycetales bacterium]
MASTPHFFGVLNLHKPAGISSRKVVDRVQRIVRPAKAGHAGTLDPLASGVLVVCVGPATRLIPYVQEGVKEYRARFLLGRTSDTDDLEGEVVEVAGGETPVARERIEEALPRFVGDIAQVPPRFSAVHVEGRRAYELARRGEAVEIAPRTVHVERIELVRYEHPELDLHITCGSGTYIRSIGRDLGNALGCGAVMAELVRTRIGPFTLEAAVPLDRLDAASLPAHLLPAATAVAHLPQWRCDEAEVALLRNGRAIVAALADVPPQATVAILDPQGELAALAEHRADEGRLAPRQVFLKSDE